MRIDGKDEGKMWEIIKKMEEQREGDSQGWKELPSIEQL